MLKNLLIILFVLNITYLWAKNDGDSLYKEARKGRDIILAKKAYEFAVNSNNQKVAANSLYLMGWLYRQSDDYVNAVEYYTQASTIYQEIEETRLLANVYDDIGSIFFHALHYKNAERLYKKALEIRKNDLSSEYGETLFNIGLTKRRLGEHDSALYYYERAASHYIEADKAKPLLNIYNNMGMVMEMTKSYELASKYYIETLERAKTESDTIMISRALHNLGSVAIKQNQLDGALYYYNRALDMRKSLGRPRLLMSTLNNLGHAYLQDNQRERAYHYFLEALEYSDHSDNELLMDTYLQLSNLEESKEDFDAALLYSRKYEAITQTLYALNKELEDKYLFLRGKLALEHLNQLEQNRKRAQLEFWWWVSVGIFGTITLLISLYLYLKARSRKRTIDLIVQDLTG